MPLTFKLPEEEDKPLNDSLFDNELSPENVDLDMTNLEEILNIELSPSEIDALANQITDNFDLGGMDLQSILDELRKVREQYNENDND